MRIRRATLAFINVNVSATLAECTELDLREAAAGSVLIPSGSGLTTLTPYAAREPGGTYLPLYDAQGLAAAWTVAAGQCHPLPEAVAAVGALRLVGNTTGSVEVVLKG
ncbi:MAG: hypothetical protein SFX18_01700 [Pirellulales bacterium]|nr:hypothetical protein [Pirellulales bacterium]